MTYWFAEPEKRPILAVPLKSFSFHFPAPAAPGWEWWHGMLVPDTVPPKRHTSLLERMVDRFKPTVSGILLRQDPAWWGGTIATNDPFGTDFEADVRNLRRHLAVSSSVPDVYFRASGGSDLWRADLTKRYPYEV